MAYKALETILHDYSRKEHVPVGCALSLYVVIDISRTLEVYYFCLDVLSAAACAEAAIA